MHGTGNVHEVLTSLIECKKINTKTLSKVANLEEEEVKHFCSTGDFSNLSSANINRLSELALMLKVGMELVDDDFRVCSIIEELINNYYLDYKSISLYVGIDEEEIRSFVSNPGTIPYELKYRITVKVYMLFYIFK